VVAVVPEQPDRSIPPARVIKSTRLWNLLNLIRIELRIEHICVPLSFLLIGESVIITAVGGKPFGASLF
jgi:hypothetical protein